MEASSKLWNQQEEGHEENVGVINTFALSTVVMASQVYTNIKIYQVAYLKYVQLIIYINFTSKNTTCS